MFMEEEESQQQEGRGSNLSQESHSRGRESSGNFANDPQRAREAGRKGGQH